MDLRKQMAALKAAMNEIVTKAKSEARDLTEDEATEIETKANEYEVLNSRLEKATKAAARVSSIAVVEDDGTDGGPEDGRKSDDGIVPGHFGPSFVKSESYQAFKSKNPMGVGSNSAGPINIEAKLGPMTGLFQTGRKAVNVIGMQEQPTSFQNPERFPTIDYTGPEDVSLLDLITRGRMSGSMIEYLQIVSVQEGAKIVAPGALKPTSDFVTALADAKAYTYADGFDVTNQSLADDAFVSSYLQARLPRHLRNEVQRVLLAGTGTGGEPRGILNTTGVQNQSWDGNLLDTIASMIEKVEEADGVCTAIALSVHSAWRLMREKDENGRYFSQGPWSQGPGTVWGIPYVKVPRLATNTAIAGDFRTVALLDREGISVQAFNQHKDYAQRNLTYVRAELRAAQAIFEPSKLVVANLVAP